MKIVCLANSFRTGGRCLGGVELDKNNNPIFANNRPKWVRPVCNTQNEEVPNHLASHISLLDIIEFQEINVSGHGHQTENVMFNTSNSIQVVGSFPIDKLSNLTGNKRFSLIFNNRGAAVIETEIPNFDYSLKLIELTQFETNERVFEGKPYPQIKLSFRYNNVLYNFPITDPDFLQNYKRDKNILQGKNRIFVTFSLAAPHEGWSSKLVAGIMFEENTKTHSSFDDEDDLLF